MQIYSSVGKESAYNTEDLGSILEWERSPGEGNGNPLQYAPWRIPCTEEPAELRTGHKVSDNLASKPPPIWLIFLNLRN